MSRAVPKYRRHPNGQAFIKTVRINNGRPLYLGPFGSEKSKLAYQRALKRLSAPAAPAPKLDADPDRTIVELILSYYEYARRYYSKDGRPTKEYKEMVIALRPLDALFGDTLAAEFGPKRLVRLQEHMVGLDWSRKVINHRISRVKRFFRWCSKEEFVPHELYAGLKAVDCLRKGRCSARELAKVLPVPRAWVDQTLPFMTSTVAAMAKVQLLCGMRPAEVCSMRGKDINMTGPIWLYTPPEHKNAWREIVRVIAIPKAAQRVLSPFLKTNIEAYLFSPREAEATRNAGRASNPDRKTPIYPSELRARARAKQARKNRVTKRPKRERYDTDSYRRAIKYAIDKAERAGVEIPHWHPHQLRHTISTEISQVIGEQAAQRWLGHEHLETTGIYTEKQVSELIEIAEKLDRRWTG